jgi:hypothetical protein
MDEMYVMGTMYQVLKLWSLEQTGVIVSARSDNWWYSSDEKVLPLQDRTL